MYVYWLWPYTYTCVCMCICIRVCICWVWAHEDFARSLVVAASGWAAGELWELMELGAREIELGGEIELGEAVDEGDASDGFTEWAGCRCAGVCPDGVDRSQR